MLVLQRKLGESIRIGSDIEVVVLGVSGGRTQLGFKCPAEVPIRRRELPQFGAKLHAEKSAARTPPHQRRTA
jgi:carbon storage regulator